MPRRKADRGTPRPPDDLEDLFGSNDPPAKAKKKPKADPEGWPETAPALTAEDLVWQFESHDGRGDLLAWLERAFRGAWPVTAEPPAYRLAYVALCAELTKALSQEVTDLWQFLSDAWRTRTPPLATQAACWNRMLISAGYALPRTTNRRV